MQQFFVYFLLLYSQAAGTANLFLEYPKPELYLALQFGAHATTRLVTDYVTIIART